MTHSCIRLLRNEDISKSLNTSLRFTEVYFLYLQYDKREIVCMELNTFSLVYKEKTMNPSSNVVFHFFFGDDIKYAEDRLRD